MAWLKCLLKFITGGEKTTASHGLLQGALAAFFFSIMSSLIYAVTRNEPAASIFVASFIRILVNLLILLSPVFYVWSVRPLRDLLGDRRASLWLRGIFGTASLMCSFASLKAIGLGDSSFLNSSSGVFVALLGPLLLKQKNSPVAWLAIAGSMVGLFMLYHPRFDDASPYGRILGLSSGFLAAIAYLMIARAGRSNSPRSVVFYFALVAIVAHIAAFFMFDITWPQRWSSYALLIAAGIVASIAQILLTRSYQHAPAAYSAAVSYLSPVCNMLVGLILFSDIPDLASWCGAGMVLSCGVLLPFIRLHQVARRRQALAAKTTA